MKKILFCFLLSVVLGLIPAGCASDDPANAAAQVAAPQFSPRTGIYTSSQSVTISCATPGAVIRYTTDGSDPAGSGGIVYSTNITVTGDCLLQAVARKDGLDDSRTGYAWYEFTGPGGPAITGITTGVRQATVSWDPVPGAVAYNIYHAEGTNTTKATAIRVVNVTSPCTVTNIRGRAHAFFIVAIDSNGEGVAGPVSTAVPDKGWIPKGAAGFKAGTAKSTRIKMGSDNTPYLAFIDGAQGNKVSVMRYGAAGWEYVGSAGFSAGALPAGANTFISLALDSNNAPYVAYQDTANSNRVTVMRYTGTAWEAVGGVGFTASAADYMVLALDSNNLPYVAYRETSGFKSRMMRYTGTCWEDVGSRGFAGSTGTAYFYSFAFDSNNVPYIAFKDMNNNEGAVMRYLGTGWETVGGASFSAGAGHISMALDSNKLPYVAYSESINSNKATVMRFTGTAWETVGPAGFSAGTALYTSLALDSDNTPYVAYVDTANSDRATVMRYTGTAWEAVGVAGFSAGNAGAPSLALDSDNTPFVAYADGANGNKATVMVFE